MKCTDADPPTPADKLVLPQTIDLRAGKHTMSLLRESVSAGGGFVLRPPLRWSKTSTSPAHRPSKNLAATP